MLCGIWAGVAVVGSTSRAPSPVAYIRHDTASHREAATLRVDDINPTPLPAPPHYLIYLSVFIPLTPSAFLSHPPHACLSHTHTHTAWCAWCVCMSCCSHMADGSCGKREILRTRASSLPLLLLTTLSSSLPVSPRQDDLFLALASSQSSSASSSAAAASSSSAGHTHLWTRADLTTGQVTLCPLPPDLVMMQHLWCQPVRRCGFPWLPGCLLPVWEGVPSLGSTLLRLRCDLSVAAPGSRLRWGSLAQKAQGQRNMIPRRSACLSVWSRGSSAAK